MSFVAKLSTESEGLSFGLYWKWRRKKFVENDSENLLLSLNIFYVNKLKATRIRQVKNRVNFGVFWDSGAILSGSETYES